MHGPARWAAIIGGTATLAACDTGSTVMTQKHYSLLLMDMTVPSVNRGRALGGVVVLVNGAAVRMRTPAASAHPGKPEVRSMGFSSVGTPLARRSPWADGSLWHVCIASTTAGPRR
jgi:hypothetical protein